FWMDLQPADVDDPVPSSDEVVAATAEVDHIPGVDEPILTGERRALVAQVAQPVSPRANAQRAVLDLHHHATAALLHQARGKACKTIAHVERHTGFRRGERMGDLGLWVDRLEMVQDGLVGDLSRQANVPRRDRVSRRAHQSAAPMRWSPGDMGDTESA